MDDQSLFVMGGIPQLGNWQLDKAFSLAEVESSLWEGEVSCQCLLFQSKTTVVGFPFCYTVLIWLAIYCVAFMCIVSALISHMITFNFFLVYHWCYRFVYH